MTRQAVCVLLWATVAWGLSATSVAAAAADDPADAAALDDALLEDLGGSLLDGEPAAADVPGGQSGDQQRRKLDDEFARKLVEPAGEDLGAEKGRPAPDDWLRQVTQRMREAESALAERDASGRASAAQQDAVSQLDAAIARLQKQCEKCGGQCNKPGSPSDKPPKASPKSGAKPGASSVQLDGAPPADRTALGALVKDLWGELPERQREELLQPLSEEFLPEYAAEIEEYFRALAEPKDAAENRP